MFVEEHSSNVVKMAEDLNHRDDVEAVAEPEDIHAIRLRSLMADNFDREFPSLSTNPQQQGTASASSMWANSTGRSAMQTQSQRIPQSGMMSSLQQTQAQQQTQQQQDDLFSTSSQLPSTQGAFRFGGQSAVGQPQGNPSDEFPPLSRNTNGEIGQDRASGLMQSFNSTQNNSGFGSGLGGNLGGGSNGLLNALSSSSRAAANQTGATSPRSVGGTESWSGEDHEAHFIRTISHEITGGEQQIEFHRTRRCKYIYCRHRFVYLILIFVFRHSEGHLHRILMLSLDDLVSLVHFSPRYKQEYDYPRGLNSPRVQCRRLKTLLQDLAIKTGSD